ncbi:MAG: LacI family DNA-binding transcriptional regulator [Bacteroidia bacterium]|nr:LacI family DNA-binding transcriptional regulator [Bacteroidia bacterium]
MKKKQVTLLELAKRLNLSPSTVSRALNDRHRISETTRSRVKALAEELEYQPNPSAKSLRESKTYSLGVLVPEIAHNFFATTISGIEKAAIAAGYNIMICQSHESYEREKAISYALLSSRVDGLLVCPSGETQDFKHFAAFIRKDIPVVFFDRISMSFQASKVVVNDFEGSRTAVEYLIRTGCRRIAHIAGPAPLSNSTERLNGYLAALETYNIPDDDTLIRHCDMTRAHAKQITEELLQLPVRPDALFTFNDNIAYDVIQVVKKMGLRIPEDISIVGFSDQPMSEMIEPSLTSVSQPAYSIGEVAVKLMFEQLNAEDGQAPFRTEVLKTELVVRDSTRKL